MFFSTIARVTAAVIGFIATIGIAIHQLETRERRRRTQELREILIGAKNKYSQLMFEIAEMIEQPFDEEFVPDGNQLDIEESSVQEIINANSSTFDKPVHSKTSILLIKSGRILDSISPSENAKEDNLISKSDITDLQNSCDYIYKYMSDPDSPIFQEYEEELSRQEVGLSSNIFDSHNSGEYENIEDWIDDNVNSSESKEQLSGKNIISVANIFREFESDLNIISKKLENTIIDGDINIIDDKIYPIGLLISGVILPLCGLMAYPNWVPTISGTVLFAYQMLLMASTIVFGYYTIDQLL